MLKRKKVKEALADELEPTGTPTKADEQPKNKELPPLPVSDATAAGLIAVVFALIGAVIAVKAAAQDKEPKPKKAKRAKNVTKKD